MASGTELMRQGIQGIAWDTHICARPWDFRLEEIHFPVRLLHGEAADGNGGCSGSQGS